MAIETNEKRNRPVGSGLAATGSLGAGLVMAEGKGRVNRRVLHRHGVFHLTTMSIILFLFTSNLHLHSLISSNTWNSGNVGRNCCLVILAIIPTLMFINDL